MVVAQALPLRLAAWVAERHGASVVAPVALLAAASIGAGARDRAGRGAGDRPAAAHVAVGAAAIWSWYLMLRVLDDLEDAAADRTEHPDRLLSRGTVTTTDLWLLAGAALATQAAASSLIDGRRVGPVTRTWAAMAAFLGACAVDFGVPAQLAARPTLRRALRAPASILPALWGFAIGAGGTPLRRPAAKLVGFAVALVAAVDITRRPATSPGAAT
jgi:4-hydroxybenzoate polyprenyltransferase